MLMTLQVMYRLLAVGVSWFWFNTLFSFPTPTFSFGDAAFCVSMPSVRHVEI